MTYPTIMPALTLDFQNSQQLDPRVTFSRSSSATYINSAGLVVSAADHEPRFDHDPVTGECLGLLIEESRTNVIEYSTAPDAQFNQDASNFTYTFNQPAPDGSSDAYLMENVSNTSGNRGGYFASYATIPTTGKITVSVFVKPIGGQVIYLGGDPGNQGYYGVPLVKYDFTVSPPEASFTGVQHGFTAVPSIQEIGNGWYRLIEVIDLTNGTGFLNGQTRGPRVANTTPGTSTVVWGYQIEEGEFPTSLIPTSGSTVTRAADIAQITGTNFSSWYNQSEGTVFEGVSPLSLNDDSSGFFNFISSDNSRWQAYLNSGPTQIRSQLSSPGNSPKTTIISNSANVINTFAVTQSATSLDFALAANGQSAVSGTYNQPGTFTGIEITNAKNKNTGGTVNNNYQSQLSGHISRLTYYNERLTDAELQTLTS